MDSNNTGAGLGKRLKKLVTRHPSENGTSASGPPAGSDTGPLRSLPEGKTDLPPQRIIFQTLTAEPQVIGVEIEDVIVIGRSEPGYGTSPDLDLTSHNGQAHGVSRRHAILLPTDEGLCMVDLDSMNGTWINGMYLQPGQKYRIRSGDRVEFGTLKLLVRVAGAVQTGRGKDSTAYTRSKPRNK
jgi:pSer/pThr/pTyr-binding forkhead associated (FHA) protein